MPRFWFAQPEDGVRIPFNDNDVDCIVNINVQMNEIIIYKLEHIVIRIINFKTLIN